MIRLTLPPRPELLTEELIDQLTTKFKENPKKAVWKAHAIKDALKDTLLKASHGKCAFSEILLDVEGKDMQIEHFYPKSKYPEKVMEWGNLLPCANLCNRKKGDQDPKEQPLVNPFFDDPKDYFFIENGKLWPIDCNDSKAIETLNKYDLNNPSQLRVPRYRYQSELKLRLSDLREDFVSNPVRSTNRLKSLMNECGRHSAYSATKSTVLLSDENFIYMKSELAERGIWDDQFLILEKELKFCSLPKPISK